MKIIIQLFGVLMLLSGIYLLINPEFFFNFIDDNMESTSLYIFAIVVRLFLGVIFLIAAKESKFPGIIKFLGYLFILAALLFIFMGLENFQEFFSSFLPKVQPYAPVSGLVSIAFGAFLIYAFPGNEKSAKK